MDKAKQAVEMTEIDAREAQDGAASQIRTLQDLELVLAGGGDTIVDWG